MLAAIRGAIGRLRTQERLLMITVSTVLVMSGQGVIAPVLPLYARSLGVTIAAVGLALGIFGLARLLLNIPIGIASDRFGRRPVLIAGPMVVALGMLGSGLADGLPELLVARFIAGAGSAMYMTGAQLYLVDISTPLNRARFIATNQGALLAGVAIGPGVGGLLAQAYGFRVPFHVVAAGALVAGLYALWRIPETNQDRGRVSDRDRPARWDWLRFAASPNFIAVGLVTLAIFGTRLGARGTLLPLLGALQFGMSPGALGGVLTATAIGGLVVIGPAAFLADRFGRKATIVPAGFLTAAGILLMAVATSVPVLIAGAVLTTVGTGLAGPAPAAFLGDIAPPRLRGLSMGLFRTTGDIGFVAAPPLLGALADSTSIGWALVANAALVMFASAFFGVVVREPRAHRKEASRRADIVEA